MRQDIRAWNILIFIVVLSSFWQTSAIAADCAIPAVTKDNVINALDDLIMGECLGAEQRKRPTHEGDA